MTMTAGGFTGDSGPTTGAPPGAGSLAADAPSVAGRGPDEAVTALYQTQYAVLVRTAALLVGDLATAEDVVRDSFVAMHRAWWRLRDTRKALLYLHRSVINMSRLVARHQAMADCHPPMLVPQQPSSGESALTAAGQSSVLAALSALPCSQREVLVLRFYADLSEEQTAAAMGITSDAVKRCTARANDSLRAVLEH